MDERRRRVRRVPRFIRCSNCGRYLPASRLLPGGYCSSECQFRYSRCVNCGRPFLKGFDAVLCSEECGREYKLEKVEYPA